jgi:hypothetical protein
LNKNEEVWLEEIEGGEEIEKFHSGLAYLIGLLVVYKSFSQLLLVLLE